MNTEQHVSSRQDMAIEREKKELTFLQSAAVDDLVVDSKLTAVIVNDEHADAATAVVERLLKALEQVALVQDGQTLLDITSLGHGNDGTVITDVEDAVLLEDRTDHVLDNHRWAGVADERALLMELLGEEVDTEIAVLARLCRSGDADDLAWTTLQDQQVSNADVVAGNGDGVGRTRRAGSSRITSTWSTHGDFAVLDNNVFFNTLGAAFVLVVVVMVRMTFEGVKDAVCGTTNSVAE